MVPSLHSYKTSLPPWDLALRVKGLMVQEGFVDYGLVDHKRDMLAQGVSSPMWAYTLFFAKPVRNVLAAAPTAVTNMLIRVGICGDLDHSMLVHHTMSSLLANHNETLRSVDDQIDQTIATIAEKIGATAVICPTPA